RSVPAPRRPRSPRTPGRAWRETPTRRNAPAPPPCAAAAAGRGTAVPSAAPGVRPAALSPCARSRRAAAQPRAPPSSGRAGRTRRGSLPYGEHHQQRHQRAEDQRQVTADGQELKLVEALGDEADQPRDRRIQHVPRNVAQAHVQPGGARIARRRQVDFLARAEYHAAERRTAADAQRWMTSAPRPAASAMKKKSSRPL